MARIPKRIPPESDVRNAIASAAAKIASDTEIAPPVPLSRLQQLAAGLLEESGLPSEYAGFTMVMLNNEFWRDRFFSIPFERRLLLLPHCLKDLNRCPGIYDDVGLICTDCDLCAMASYKGTAERLGYTVLIAEGTPIVLKIILAGRVDGILGVSCLNVLEKAFPKMNLVGIPGFAVPLLKTNCKNTAVDPNWIMTAITSYQPSSAVASGQSEAVS